MAKHQTTVVLKAKDETKRALSSAESGMARTEKQAKLLSGSLARVAGLMSIAAVGGLVKGALASTDALAKQSRQLGVSVERLQELEFAASQSGIEMTTLTMALQRFGRRSAEAAQGTGEAVNALKALGIQLHDSEGNMRGVNDLFTEAINKLGMMENAAQRNALAMKLFDSEGVRLVRFGKNLDTLSEKAVAQLDIITQAQAESAERINDEFDLLARKASQLSKTFILDVAGGATYAYKSILQLTEGGRDYMAAQENSAMRMLENLEEQEEKTKDLEKATKSLTDETISAAQKIAGAWDDAGKQAEAFGKALEYASSQQDKIKDSLEGIQDIQEGRSRKPATVLGALTASSEARRALASGNTTKAAELALRAAEELRQVEEETGKNVTNAEAFIKNFEAIAKEALEKSEKAQERLKLEINIGGETQTFDFSEAGVKQAGDFTTDRIKKAARKAG